MLHETTSKRTKRPAKYKKAGTEPKPAADHDEILATARLETSDSGKTVISEEDDALFSIFQEMSFVEGKNEIKICMRKQKNRAVRLEISLNGVEIRPATFTGSLSAMNYWKLLQSLVKGK